MLDCTKHEHILDANVLQPFKKVKLENEKEEKKKKNSHRSHNPLTEKQVEASGTSRT